MNSLERLDKLSIAGRGASNLVSKRKVQEAAEKILDKIYFDQKKIREMEAWLNRNWPQHSLASESLQKYEQKCLQFLEEHGFYEYQLDDAEFKDGLFFDPIKNIKGTAIDKNGEKQMTIEEWHGSLSSA